MTSPPPDDGVIVLFFILVVLATWGAGEAMLWVAQRLFP